MGPSRPTDEQADSAVDADNANRADADGTASHARNAKHADKALDAKHADNALDADASDGTDEPDGHRSPRRAISGARRRASRFLGQLAPPPPDPEFPKTPTKSVRVSVLSATLCLGVSALLVSGKIVEIADRLPFGPDRDRWLAAATELDRVGGQLGLDRPYDLLRELRGAGDEAGQQIDVIGDVQDLLSLGSPPDPLGTSGPAPTDPPNAATVGRSQQSDSGEGRAAAGTQANPDSDGHPTSEASGPEPDQTAPAEDGNAGSESGQTAPAENGDAGRDSGQTDPAENGDAGRDHDSAAPTADGPPGTDQGDPGRGADLLAPSDTAVGTGEPEAEPPPAYERPEPVSADAPLRAYVAGDSQAFHLGHALRASPMSELMEITLYQRHSTGLTRPGYFNWPVHMFFVAVGSDPELLVMTLGSNDWQAMRSEDGQTLARGSGEWVAEWGRRLSVMLDALAAPHRQIVWVGLPPTRADDFREGYALMNGIVAGIAADRDFVTLIDIWDMFGGDEPYRESVPPPGDPDGAPVDVRQDDGVHLNRRGAEWVLELLEDEIRRLWDLPTG